MVKNIVTIFNKDAAGNVFKTQENVSGIYSYGSMTSFKTFANYTLPFPMPASGVRYEPSVLAPAVDGSGRVTTLFDINGTANATAITGGTIPPGGAPKLVTDRLGRKALLFEGTNALEIADTLSSYTTSGLTTYAVVCFFDPNDVNSQSMFSAGRNAGTPINQIKAFMTTTNGIALGVPANAFPAGPACAGKPLWDAAGVYGTERSAGNSRRKMPVHSGLQVIAISGGVGGTGIIAMNDEYCSAIGAPTNNTVSVSGGEIGRYSFAPASTNYMSGLVYAMYIRKSATSASDMQANIAAIMAAYGIQPVTNRFILEGDSRFANTGAKSLGESPYNYLQVKVADLLPSSWSVIAASRGGTTIDADVGATGANIDAGMRNRWGYANQSLFSGIFTLPGRNVVAVEDWYNDDGQTTVGNPRYTAATFTAARADQIYANMQDFITNDATSVLSRGYEYLASIPMPAPTTKDPSLNEMRAKLRSANFFHDFLGAVGDTYAGKVRRAETPLSMPIAGAWGSQVLDTGLTAGDGRIVSNGGLYFADQAHPNNSAAPHIAACLVNRVLGADPYV